MKILLIALPLFALLASCSTLSFINGLRTPKEVKVYTTASNTDLRLTITNNLEFKDTPQPIESEVSV